MNSLGIKKDDNVIVIAGKEKGKQGKVISTSFEKGTVMVEGVNIVKKHKKPRKQGEDGGILDMEAPIRANKVMRICPKCSKPTRIGYTFTADGKKARKCKKCGETI